MERKETAASDPLGICEKLFNALHLNPTFRPFRRIGYHPQEPVAAAAAMPAPSPPIPNSVGRASTPPTKSSGLEHPGGDVGILHQSVVSMVKAPEVTTSKMEPERVRVPLKAPSKVEPPVNTIPSKNFTTYAEPQALPPSQLQTERESSTHGKAPPPPPTPAPAPEKVVPKLEDVQTSVDNEKPAVAETGRTRTRRNLNEKVDEYINRTRNRMRSSSNAGSSSSKG